MPCFGTHTLETSGIYVFFLIKQQTVKENLVWSVVVAMANVFAAHSPVPFSL